MASSNSEDDLVVVLGATETSLEGARACSMLKWWCWGSQRTGDSIVACGGHGGTLETDGCI